MRHIYFLLFFSFAQLLNGQGNFKPETGDLFFQDLDCGPFCDAIEKVTWGIDGLDFSHVGIALVENDKTFVLEAGGLGVVKTPLDSFLNRSADRENHTNVVVGRLKTQYRYSIPRAIEKSNSLLGKKYDDVFDIGNDSYYCSELVYYSFIDSIGNPLFKLAPMTFIDPDTKQIFPAWVNYFNELHAPIPEGEPGLNPGGISRSEKIEIVYHYF
jgi:hypothetical protein